MQVNTDSPLRDLRGAAIFERDGGIYRAVRVPLPARGRRPAAVRAATASPRMRYPVGMRFAGLLLT